MECVNWTAVAPAWDRHRTGIELMKTELSDALIDGLGDVTGARVLELGAGTGELAARLADLVGPAGSLVATDLADGMVELIRTRLAGTPQAAAAVADATALAYPDASFDAVVFRMGLMLIPEPERALREIRRVLRPGGRVAIAVWGAPPDNPWLTTLGMSAMMHGVIQGGPPVGPGGPFSLADPDDLEKRLRNEGFGEVSVTPISSTRHFVSADEHFDMVRTLAPPLASALAAAPPDKVALVRQTFDGLVAQYRDEDGLHVPVSALLCLAG